MAKRIGETLPWIYDRHRKRAQFNVIAIRSDPVPEFVIVGEMIYERLESSDSGQSLLRRRHHSAKHEIEIAQHRCHQYAGSEIRAVSERFEVGGERPVRF